MEHSDTQNYSDLLLDLKLNPEDLRVPIPKFFLEESQPELEARIKALEQFNARTLAENESLVTFDTFSIADAVRVIQMNERGRQGKNRAAYMKEVKLQAAREKNMDNDDETVDVNLAALKIQKRWVIFIYLFLFRLKQHLTFIINSVTEVTSHVKPTENSSTKNSNSSACAIKTPSAISEKPTPSPKASKTVIVVKSFKRPTKKNTNPLYKARKRKLQKLRDLI